MEEAHIFRLDPVEVEREEVGPEAFGHAMREAGGRALLIGPEDPAAALLARVPMRVGVAEDGVLRPVFAERGERRVGPGHDVLVLDRDRRELQPEEPGGALGMVAGGGDDMLGGDLHPLVGGDQVAAMLDHPGEGHHPFRARPAEGVRLPASLDRHAAAPGAAGERLGQVGGVDVAVGRMEERAGEVVGAHERPARADLAGREPLVGDAGRLRRGGVEAILVHPRFSLRHAEVADHAEAGIEPGLGVERLVEPDRVIVDVGGRVGHVEEGEQARSVPSRAGGELVALHQQDVGPADAGERIGDRRSHRPAADDEDPDMFLHS